ncbi:MAG: sugar ABC transporter permease, partial [Candidatus Omnitrophica bacterium]|nr:sugar ABC transporter permease [Candidatus Omnitrophota bacterium]
MFSHADIRNPMNRNALDAFKNFMFVLPAVAIFALFYIIPFINLIIISLHSWPGIGPMTWVGLQNFQDLAQDARWWVSMWHAAYITIIALTFQNA